MCASYFSVYFVLMPIFQTNILVKFINVVRSGNRKGFPGHHCYASATLECAQFDLQCQQNLHAHCSLMSPINTPKNSAV